MILLFLALCESIHASLSMNHDNFDACCDSTSCHFDKIWNHIGDESLDIPVGDYLYYVD